MAAKSPFRFLSNTTTRHWIKVEPMNPISMNCKEALCLPKRYHWCGLVQQIDNQEVSMRSIIKFRVKIHLGITRIFLNLLEIIHQIFFSFVDRTWTLLYTIFNTMILLERFFSSLPGSDLCWGLRTIKLLAIKVIFWLRVYKMQWDGRWWCRRVMIKQDCWAFYGARNFWHCLCSVLS